MDTKFKLDDRLFVAIFEKHLCQLKSLGFTTECFYPENLEQTLVLRFFGPFVIEITRDERANPNMQLCPQNLPLPLSGKKINFSELVFLLTGGKEYIVPYFYDILRYFPVYEQKIGLICQKFFEYYDRIAKALQPENALKLYAQVEELRIPMLKAGGFLPEWYKEKDS